jgi:ABC-type lipoprotein release transport system permease subunit
VSFLIAGPALAACYLPVRTATRLDAVAVLRTE